MVQLIKIDRLGPRIEGMLYKVNFDETWALLDDVRFNLFILWIVVAVYESLGVHGLRWYFAILIGQWTRVKQYRFTAFNVNKTRHGHFQDIDWQESKSITAGPQ